MLNGVCQVNYFGLSMIHLLDYGLRLPLHSHENEIANEMSNDKFAQLQTRRQLIHATTKAGVVFSSPAIKVCVVFCANFIPIQHMAISTTFVGNVQPQF